MYVHDPLIKRASLALAQIKDSFGAAEKHEQFTAILLDALSAEGGVMLASIAAMKCKGVDQETIDAVLGTNDGGTGFISKISLRQDSLFNPSDPDSIMGNLDSR